MNKKLNNMPIHLTKQVNMSNSSKILLRIASVLLALVVGGIFIAILGFNPFEAYKAIIDGCFRSKISFQSTVSLWIPLVITSLGLSFAFKMKFWNIGAEGQIMMGGIFSCFFALNCSDWPKIILIPVMFIAGAIGGGIFALIPALFKVKFGTNETLFTLMLNYVAQYLIAFLISGPWKRTQGFASIGSFDENVFLPKVFGIHIGWIIAVLLIVFVYVYLTYTKRGYEISVVGGSQETARYSGMNVKKIIIRTMFISGAICGIVGYLTYTKRGYEISVVGGSQETARYSGMNVKKIIIRTMFISGAICGIVGMVQSTGYDHTLTTGVTGGVGWTGIIIAWLSQLNPIIISIVSAFFAILEKGSSNMQTAIGISAYAADVLQGIILFFVLGSEFFINYKITFGSSKSKKGAK